MFILIVLLDMRWSTFSNTMYKLAKMIWTLNLIDSDKSEFFIDIAF